MCFVHIVADLTSVLLVVYQMRRTPFSHSAHGGSGQHIDSLRVGRFGVKSRCGRNFPLPLRPAPWPTQPPLQWMPILCPGGKVAGAWRDHPPQSSAEVKERVQLYLTPHPLAFITCYRLTFTFYFSGNVGCRKL